MILEIAKAKQNLITLIKALSSTLTLGKNHRMTKTAIILKIRHPTKFNTNKRPDHKLGKELCS